MLVVSLMAVSLMRFPPEAPFSGPVYGLPELNCITVLMVQCDRMDRATSFPIAETSAAQQLEIFLHGIANVFIDDLRIFPSPLRIEMGVAHGIKAGIPYMG